MGNSSSKHKNQPWPSYAPMMPGYGPGYYPGAPGAGYMQPQMQPMQPMQPFIPQMPGVAMPQRHSTRRSSRRKRSTRSRTRPQLSQPIVQPEPDAPVIPGETVPNPSRVPRSMSRAASRAASEHRPRRTQTPFPSNHGPPPSPSSSEEEAMLTDPHAARPNPNLANLVTPMPAANPDVYGPQDGRQHAPENYDEIFRENPLPTPPRDLYEMSPYKHIMQLPTNRELLLHGQGGTGAFLPTRRATRKRGFFRSLFHPEDPEPVQPDTRFIPVVYHNDRTEANLRTTAGTVPIPAQVNPPVEQSFVPVMSAADFHNARETGFNPVSQPPPGPVRMDQVHMVPPASGITRFNQEGPYPGFLNHSPYRVMYRNSLYPTATNLHEAMKFLPARPDLAEVLRNTPVSDVYQVSSDFERRFGISADWETRFQTDMDNVLRLKFNQHPDLRSQILMTGNDELVYDDPNDDFWGTGPAGTGANEMGHALMRVRDYLRETLQHAR